METDNVSETMTVWFNLTEFSDYVNDSEIWSELFAMQPNYWCLLLLVFPVLTVFGNVLVCLSVYQEKALHTASVTACFTDALHTVTNYFICSLAIADIMVAILVMPFAVYVEVSGISQFY